MALLKVPVGSPQMRVAAVRQVRKTRMVFTGLVPPRLRGAFKVVLPHVSRHTEYVPRGRDEAGYGILRLVLEPYSPSPRSSVAGNPGFDFVQRRHALVLTDCFDRRKSPATGSKKTSGNDVGPMQCRQKKSS
jgi:hypothetical protein